MKYNEMTLRSGGHVTTLTTKEGIKVERVFLYPQTPNVGNDPTMLKPVQFTIPLAVEFLNSKKNLWGLQPNTSSNIVSTNLVIEAKKAITEKDAEIAALRAKLTSQNDEVKKRGRKEEIKSTISSEMKEV